MMRCAALKEIVKKMIRREKMAKYRWKIVGIVLAVVAYLVLLGYIDSVQSDYDVTIITEKEVYEFSANEA